MDQLEKFMHENRSAFDTEVPRLDVWANIDRDLDKRAKPKIVWMRRLMAVAAVAILLVSASVIGFQFGMEKAEAKALADISPEHADLERFYQEEISTKMAQLVAYNEDGFVKADFKELDAIYEELKQELQKAPDGSEEQVIQAMISNYQTKIDILEQVLTKVQTTGQTNLKTEENEVSL